jgi:deoxyribonuclease-4
MTAKIGCHVSIAGGVFNAPGRAAELGAECFQMFSRSPRGGKASELTDEVISKWESELEKYKIKNVYIHTPYYINFTSTNNRIRHGSVSVVRDELERGSMLGVKYVMTHLGSAKDMDPKEAVKKTAEMLAKSLDGYTGTTKLLIENAAGAGAIIGDDFKEIKKIIKLTGNKNIAGVCLDTQHSFAYGYDWRTKKSADEAFARIDKELGLKYIKLMHVNDSKVELGALRDRHEHIGDGYIGKNGFKNIVALAKKNGADMILETPHDKVREDIGILKKFRDLK